MAFADIRAIPDDAAPPGLEPGTRRLTLDVTARDAWNAALAEIAVRFGGLDVLVNCAGITGIENPQSPDEIDPETWRRVHSVNVEGVVIGCRAALPALRQGHGAAIVNVSSLAARIAAPAAGAYAASKAALSSYSRAIARYGASLSPPIRCNVVLPGAIDTPLWDACLGTGDARERRAAEIAAGVPLGRFGRAGEVAAAIAFLASDEASFITGTELVIDGGESLRM